MITNSRKFLRHRLEKYTFPAVIVLLFAVAGCTKTPERLFPVEGTVRVGDKLMNSGTIQFEMIEVGTSGKRYTSTSSIDQEGRYQLRTFGEKGAPAGRHRAWVVPNFAAMPDEIGIGVERLSPIPKKYMVPTTTDLEFEVQAAANQIDVVIPAGRR